jgi:hypothetical protein
MKKEKKMARQTEKCFRERVLLAGNGFNRVADGASFEKIIDSLIEEFKPSFESDKKAVKGKPGEKPFPLLYEEIFARYSSVSDKYPIDRDLLHSVAEQVKTMPASIAHSLAWKEYSSDEDAYSTILTSNYDQNFERALEQDAGAKITWVKDASERRYSLYRRFYAPGKKGGLPKTVWHIHGDAGNPLSICLGYEQYGGELQKIRDYVINGIEDKIDPISVRLKEMEFINSDDWVEKNRRFEYVAEKMPKQKRGSDSFFEGYSIKPVRPEIVSWVDHFFFSIVDIVGVELDTQEIDLWWLLAYRSRLIQKGGDRRPQNTIRYFYWEGEKPTERQKAARELLESLRVKLVPVGTDKAKTWEEFYRWFFSRGLKKEK